MPVPFGLFTYPLPSWPLPSPLPWPGSVWLCPLWTLPDIPASALLSLLSATNLLVYGTWDQSRSSLLLFLLSLTCLSPQRSVAPVIHHRSFSAAQEDHDRNHSIPNRATSTPVTKVQGISQKRGRKSAMRLYFLDMTGFMIAQQQDLKKCTHIHVNTCMETTGLLHIVRELWAAREC